MFAAVFAQYLLNSTTFTDSIGNVANFMDLWRVGMGKAGLAGQLELLSLHLAAAMLMHSTIRLLAADNNLRGDSAAISFAMKNYLSSDEKRLISV